MAILELTQKSVLYQFEKVWSGASSALDTIKLGETLKQNKKTVIERGVRHFCRKCKNNTKFGTIRAKHKSTPANLDVKDSSESKKRNHTPKITPTKLET